MLHRCDAIEPALQAVTAFPETISVERDASADEFIVLACDGIWDVMSSQEVVEKVRDMLINGRPPPAPPEETPTDAADSPGAPTEPPQPPPQRRWDLGAVSEALIDYCLRLGSRDNMSVIIVLLDQRLAPKPEVDSSVAVPPSTPAAPQLAAAVAAGGAARSSTSGDGAAAAVTGSAEPIGTDPIPGPWSAPHPVAPRG